MKASDWEFKHRAIIFGLIFGFAFSLYDLDLLNVTAAFSNKFAGDLHMTADAMARIVFSFAALLMIAAASIRTWASAYLDSSIVYAAAVTSESLVADGPYRYVRNPLYLANVLMAISMGTLMSRLGMVVAVTAMIVFCYRLIHREELAFGLTQSERFQAYCQAVPRLWPLWFARTGKSGNKPDWLGGFKAESWYWGVALSVIVFAITLSTTIFFIIFGASILLFWAISKISAKA